MGFCDHFKIRSIKISAFQDFAFIEVTSVAR